MWTKWTKWTGKKAFAMGPHQPIEKQPMVAVVLAMKF